MTAAHTLRLPTVSGRIGSKASEFSPEGPEGGIIFSTPVRSR